MPLQSTDNDVQVGDGNSNIVQKALNGHPVMRFFAVAGASIVAMGLAGKVVREGGLRLVEKAQKGAMEGGKYSELLDNAIGSYRRIQEHMDALQGIERDLLNPDDARLIVQRGANRKLIVGETRNIDGYSYRAAARESGRNVEKWSMRDEIQQRLVAQARRLPYEAPGLYVAQKGLLDPVFGRDDKQNTVNWHNPIDVVGDFAWQSIKQLSTNILPFEAGAAASNVGAKNLLMKINNPGNNTGLLTTRTILEQMGADMGDLLNRAVKFSHQSTGAFSSMVHDSSTAGLSFKDWVKQRSSNSILNANPNVKNANFARRLQAQAKDVALNRDSRTQAIDMLPGPFKGMGTGIQSFKRSYKELGQTYDDMQEILSGNKTLAEFRNAAKNQPEKSRQYRNLLDYMNKGGGTHIERYAEASYQLGKGGARLSDGRINPDWRTGKFFGNYSGNQYKQLVAKELADKTGLSIEESHRFVGMAHRISPIAGQNAPYPGGENLVQRFQFTTKPFSGKSEDDWWQSVVRTAGKHNLKHDGLSFQNFKDSVRNADSKWSNRGFQDLMSQDAEALWGHIHGQVIPKYANAGAQSIRRPYEFFKGTLGGGQRDWLVRRSAQKLGIDIFDVSGNQIPLDTIKQKIFNKGLNPDNLDRLKGFLVDQKEIAAPWSARGRNILGMRSMTLHEAMNNNYFANNSKGVQKEIEHIVNHKTFGPIAGRGGQTNLGMASFSNQWDQKLGGVYVSSNGKVIDVGRIKRNLMAGVDKFANEYQIPLLHMKPLQAGGWSFFQNIRNQKPIIMESGTSTQLFGMGKSAAEKPDMYLWMKADAKKSRGNVVSVTGNAFDGVKAEQLAGEYRPFNTSSNSGMAGAYSRIFVKNQGFATSQVQPDTRMGRAKRAFDISHNQEDAVVGRNGVLARLRQGYKRTDASRANPFRAAERFASTGFDTSSMTSAESEGFDNLLSMLRRFGFSKNTLQKLSKDSRFQGIFDVANTAGANPIEIQSSLLPRMIENIMLKDRQSLTGEDAIKVKRLQQNLRNLLDHNNSQNNAWDLPVTKKIRSVGIDRRIDELRSEFYTYLASRSQISQQTKSFPDTISDLLSSVEGMYSKGQISRAERTESRAAILSIQLENARNSTYKPGAGYLPLRHNESALQEALSNGSEVQQLMREVGNFEQGNMGKFSKIKRVVRKNTAMTPYDVGDEINPFNGGKHLFMPTFRSAFDNNPGKAVKGLVGGSWSDPEAVSGSTMMSTHLAMRLNRYFETFGLGIDPTQYKGPADFYAKGIVGKRILPAVAAGAAFLTADRTAGGLVNPRDQYGNKVYSPLVLGGVGKGIANAQIGLATVVPGGQTGNQKREELMNGEVPVRSGRYWLFGSTPFKGGRIQYFRPSWYKRLTAGASFTPEMHDTPLEKAAFGYDFSPLKPLDPYHYERQNYSSRPYPVTGDYFTGPWGPLNGALNATVGRVLKPRKMMHQEEMQSSLLQYLPAGESGAYFSPTPVLGSSSVSGQIASSKLSGINANYASSTPGTPSAAPFYQSMGLAAPRGYASTEVRSRASQMAAGYQSLVDNPGSYNTVGSALASYGVPSAGGLTPRLIEAQPPRNPGATSMHARKFMYQNQEMFGVYGYATSTLREKLGLGNQDLSPSQPVLEPSNRGYSASRSFWGLNLGGLGDVTTPGEGRYSNIELSELVRRFVPREQAGTQFINNIPNQLGKQFPWLPGADYTLNPLKMGDPYGQMPDAEIRLPGTGYARTHALYPDQYGQLGLANIHDILGDVAPWSKEYQAVDALANSSGLDPRSLGKINQTRAQVEAMRNKYEFTPYEYKYHSPETIAEHPVREAVGRGWEWFSHRDTYLNNKFIPDRTAAEDWERRNVYGATFTKWDAPIDSFLKPSVWKSTQRNPIAGALAGGTLGYLFGASNSARAIGSVIGGVIGGSAASYGSIYEKITGRRYLPEQRRKEMALEENVDILTYLRSQVNASRAEQSGDVQGAGSFRQQGNQTMFGIDLNSSPEQLAMAIPKRKREHFRAMLYAPEQERGEILSTAGRLERRMLEAAWGMPVEAKPDLNQYFQDHELPPPDSAVWSPGTNMDAVKIKMGQSMGLDMSQMGYYPQQVKEANLLNPVYPQFSAKNSHHSVKSQLMMLLSSQGLRGNVRQVQGNYSQNMLQLNAGVMG